MDKEVMIGEAVKMVVMKSAATARGFLNAKNYLANGQTVTLSGLSQTLMLLSQASAAVPAIVKEGMLAVAKLLQVHEQQEFSTEAIKHAQEAIAPTIDSLNERIQDGIEAINDVSTGLTMGLIRSMQKLDKDIEEKMTALTTRLDEQLTARTDHLMMDVRSEADEVIKRAKAAVQHFIALEEERPAAVCSCAHGHQHHEHEQEGERRQQQDDKRGGARGEPTPSPGPVTYARMLQMGASHPATPASQVAGDKVEARQKLVFIDLLDTPERDAIRKLPEEDLVKKANVALQLMGIMAADRPEGTCFRAARKTRNGGIIFELNSVESADWLKIPEVCARFTIDFDAGASVKGTSYPCLVKFVPIAYRIDDRDEREEVEKSAQLPLGTLFNSRWMKPPGKREKFQRYAHMIVMFPTPESANQAIRHGLYIRGARVATAQLFPEPLRCNKCSLFANHKAAECPAEKDTCGVCGQNHRTRLCTVKRVEDMFCVNCNQRGTQGGLAGLPDILEKKERAMTRATRRPASSTSSSRPIPRLGNLQSQTQVLRPLQPLPRTPPSWRGPPKPKGNSREVTPQSSPAGSSFSPSAPQTSSQQRRESTTAANPTRQPTIEKIRAMKAANDARTNTKQQPSDKATSTVAHD